MSSIKICFLCYGYEVFISCKNTYLIIATLVTSTLPSPIEKYFVFVFLKHVFIAEGKLKWKDVNLKLLFWLS
jgi:hypothetical protein